MKSLPSVGLLAILLLVASPKQTFAMWQQSPASSPPASTTILPKVDTINRRHYSDQFNAVPRRVVMSRIDTVKG